LAGLRSLEMIENSNIDRRKFLVRLGIALSALLGLVIAIPVFGALLAPLFRKIQPVWRTVGQVDHFVIGKTVLVRFRDASPLPWSGKVSQTASWLRRISEDSFIAFSVNCTHLGCPVRWIEDAELFLCPCHGGVYYKDGSHAAGPPPHGLKKYRVRLRNGNVEIEASAIPITNL
jgi:menaquinol-cytochrome c reductase iron-sulfur subunit